DYLRRLVSSGQLVIVCPAGAVTALGVSPDGARLASGHSDGTLAVWDRATGTPLGAVKAHEGEIGRVEFALGGALLVTCGPLPGHRTGVLGWNVGKGGAPGAAAPEHRVLGAGAGCFAVSPDGTVVFAGGPNGLLLKRTLSEPAPLVVRAGGPGQTGVTALAVSRDGARVLTADARGAVLCYTAALEPDAARGYRFDEPISALAVTGAGLPAVGFAGGSVSIPRPTGRPLTFPAGGRVHWLAVAPDGNFALSGHPGRVRLGPGSELPTGDAGDVRAGAFSANGKTLFTAGSDGVIRSWDVARDVRDRGVDLSGCITAVSASRDGSVRVVADRSHVNRYENERRTGDGEGAKGPLAVVRVLDNGSARAVAFEGNSVLVADLSGTTVTERLRVQVPDGRAPVSADLTPTGARVAIADDAGGVSVWAVGDRSLVGRFDTGFRRPAGAVALSDDGKIVAARAPVGVGVWVVGAPEANTLIPADDQAVFRFLPSGDRLAVAGRDGVVRVWATTGREELTLFGHVGRVTGLGVSPDGRTLVSGSATGEVRFWDLQAGVELFGVRRHSVAVTQIEFAADGKYMVTGGDGQVAVWDGR
ncbi:MAG TPA: WD40 repeat domain-containing protein, partial [Gemmata sp.]